jgi:hypothetical protein
MHARAHEDTMTLARVMEQVKIIVVSIFISLLIILDIVPFLYIEPISKTTC